MRPWGLQHHNNKNNVNDENQKDAVYRGERGVQRDLRFFFGQCPSMHTRKTCQQKHAERKWHGKTLQKLGLQKTFGYNVIFNDLAAPFFTKMVFQLSRLRCEISMSVFRGHNHKTNVKPGNTTKLGISRGFKDKSGWRKLRPNHGVNNGPRVVEITVPLCCAT